MARGWKRYANVRATAVAGSIGAVLMVWAALFNRDQATQTDASTAVLTAPVQTAAATPTPGPTSGAASASGATAAPTSTPRPTRAQQVQVQPQTRTRGS